MGVIKKSICISEDLFKEAEAINSNFSAVVENALVEYIHQHKVRKALSSFGSWAQRDESSVDIVNRMRRENDSNRY